MAEQFLARLHGGSDAGHPTDVEAPPWLADQLTDPAARRRLEAWARGVLAGCTRAMLDVPIGSGRNDALRDQSLRSYRAYIGAGLDIREVTETLGEADGGLGYTATRRTLQSSRDKALKDGPAYPRSDRDMPDTQSVDPLADNYVSSNVYTFPDGDVVEHQGDETDDDSQPSSWVAADLAAIVAGNYEPPRPEFLARRDGHRLFYKGKLNYLLGAPEGGKTWLALWAIAQTIAEGGRALFIDFEDTAETAVHRLRMLGATSEHIGRFRYVRPDEPIVGRADDDFKALLADAAPDLVLIDSFNEAMSVFGGSSNSNDDVPVFLRELPRRIVKLTGACVVINDHSRKNNASEVFGGIGAQAKRSGLDGAALLVKQISVMAAGTRGKASLTVDKDRPGGVRAEARHAKFAGTFVMDETTRGVLNVWVDGPDDDADGPGDTFRPTTLMQRVSEHLEAAEAPESQRRVTEAVTGKRAHIAEALRILAAEGHVIVDNAGRYASHRAYRSADDDLSDEYEKPAT